MRARVAIAAVVAATAIAYAPAIRAPFIFDDTVSIEHNATLASLATALHPPAESPVAGRPVANISLALNHAMVGASDSTTLPYHVTNILLHLCTGLLLFGIIRRSLRPGRFPEYWVARREWIAFAVPALWLLDPIQTEAVNYLTQRTELLASLCYAATLYASIRAWDAANGSTRVAWYVSGVAACLLGMGSKEVMVSAPIMIVLYDRAMRVESWRDVALPVMRGRRLFYTALFATLALLAGLVASLTRSAAGIGSGMSPLGYLVSQGWAIPHYLWRAIWPTHLSIDYGQTLVTGPWAVTGIIVLALLASLTLFAWVRPSRYRWLALSGAWFLAIMAPSSSIVPVATEVAADRRVYLALAAMVLLAVIGAMSALRRVAGERADSIGAALLGVVLLGFGLVTWQRSAEYQDAEALWRDAIAAVPTDPRAWNNLGSVLSMSPSRRTEGDAMFAKAIALDSAYVPALDNLATSEMQQRNIVGAEQLLRKGVAEAPDDEPTVARLGDVLLVQGDAADALPFLVHATTLAPGDINALASLGVADLALGRASAAEPVLREVLRRDPGDAVAANALATLRPAHQ